jgi:hypothetical protein
VGGVIYRNTCGQWTVEVGEPHPAWIRIKQDDYGTITETRGFTVHELRDLRYLIDRAEAAIVARKAE